MCEESMYSQEDLNEELEGYEMQIDDLEEDKKKLEKKIKELEEEKMGCLLVTADSIRTIFQALRRQAAFQTRMYNELEDDEYLDQIFETTAAIEELEKKVEEKGEAKAVD